MSIDSITAPDDWSTWVSASSTRHHVLGDPILDWLELHGASRGYARDTDAPTFDPRTDFTEFIFRQGNGFETAVLKHLATLVPVRRIVEDYTEIRSLDAVASTFRAMREGVEVIHQGVLWDPERETYGAPDLLVRSDVINRLFPGTLSPDEARVAAPDLGGPWHYRVIDVKFTTLHLLAGGDLANSGSAPAYKCQLFIYNRALGLLQGYEPPRAYLLGRAWEHQKERGFSCMDRLAPVTMSGFLAKQRPISSAVLAACEWVRTVRREGATWELFPQPARVELYPNFSNQQDGPWHAAKHRIATELEDLTMLWNVGVPGREAAHAQGIYRWTDPRVTPAVVGVTGEKRVPVLQALLDINRTADGPEILPARITQVGDEWRQTTGLDFYVDFETVSDLADDFSLIPKRGGQPLIFMIGCGHVEDGDWRFTCFVADALTEDAEARVINDWLAHMRAVEARLGGSTPARVIHWSPAEVSNFETAYNSATERHPDQSWPSPAWFDFLNRVIKAEPVVVRGAMAFGLKAVARALHAHGRIQKPWGDGPADGLGAMVGAWWAYSEAASTERAVRDIDLMRQIVDYNEVDCRVMYEAVDYFRTHH